MNGVVKPSKRRVGEGGEEEKRGTSKRGTGVKAKVTLEINRR